MTFSTCDLITAGSIASYREIF